MRALCTVLSGACVAIGAPACYHPDAQGDDDGGRDGGVDASPADRCGIPSLVPIVFGAGEALLLEWSEGTPLPTLSDTLLSVSFAPSTTGTGTFARAVTDEFFRLHEDRATIRVVSLPTGLTSQARIEFQAAFDVDNSLALAVESGVLTVRVTLAGNARVQAITAYDAEQDRYFAIHESGGMTSFETSPDGVTWSTLYQEADLALSYDFLRLGVVATSPVPEPGVSGAAIFAELDTLGDASGNYCAIDFSDAFDDATRAPVWARTLETACTATESGELAATLQTDRDAHCYYRTARRYDLAPRPITIRVSRPPASATNVGHYLLVANRAGQGAGLWIQSGQLIAFRDGFYARMVTFDPLLHGDWRISAPEPGRVRLETRGEASAWTEFYSFELDTAGVYVELDSDTRMPYETTAASATTGFDDFNQVP